MPPVRLTDDELTAVFAAAAPLDVAVRDQFLQEVASALAACPAIGPGIVHRVCAEVQREFWHPPEFSATGAGKYR